MRDDTDDISKWTIDDLDFSDIDKEFKSCGNLVIDDIVRNINNRVKPDGTTQKANEMPTILAKGHDHPLIGVSEIDKFNSFEKRNRKTIDNMFGGNTKSMLKSMGSHAKKRISARLSDPATYETTVDPEKVVITIDPAKEDIAGFVTEKGYRFFEISPKAEENIVVHFFRYLSGKIKQVFDD